MSPITLIVLSILGGSILFFLYELKMFLKEIVKNYESFIVTEKKDKMKIVLGELKAGLEKLKRQTKEQKESVEKIIETLK